MQLRMTRQFAFVDPIRSASAVPANYYYVREAGTS
jgi:hypothetical protein